MVDISIIIVNYNVRLFLEQAINAVLKARGDHAIEIIVVDNNSIDNSIEYIKSKFSFPIKFIPNQENVGFAKANNQGIKAASGKYILLLNPDTVVQEDTLSRCKDKAESDANIGAIGVRMVDGLGAYLPESKRAIPTPLNSFWKLSGVSKIFPRSSFFSEYNLGNINEESDAEVEVLCGAFMFMPHKVAIEVGMLDEDYFMYGEDIDLSFRIKKAGYKIWYLGTNSIIHYKGQSTQKSSLAYVNTFYGAMSIFAKKHYSSSSFILLFISVAIALRRFSSGSKRMIGLAFPVLLDAVIFGLGFIVIKHLWATYYFEDPHYYDQTNFTVNNILYVGIWLIVLLVSRVYLQYDKHKVFSIATVIGLVVILMVYGLMPESMRTSRAIVLIGALWVLVSGNLIRYVYRLIKKNSRSATKRIGIVGSEKEANRARSIIHSAIGHTTYVMRLDASDFSYEYLIAQKEFSQLNEIVFCLKDISIEKTLDIMSKKIKGLNYKLIGDKSINIIGSNRSNLIGEVYGIDIKYRLADELNLYYKRILDIIVSVFLLLFFPLLFISGSFRNHFSLSRLVRLLLGQMTTVGYDRSDTKLLSLPELKKGCIEISNRRTIVSNVHEQNTSYALYYTPWRDIVILFDTIF